MIYAADPMASERHHLYQEDIENNDASYLGMIGCSRAHVLCIKSNPSLSLIRFLIGLDPQVFCTSCSYFQNIEDSQYGRYPLHLVAQYSDSGALLQKKLQLDVSVTQTKNQIISGMTPLGAVCSRKYIPALMDMATCLME